MQYLRNLSGLFAPKVKQKLIISPGFRKCASTSLQSMLLSNENVLSPYFGVSCKDEITDDWRSALHEITVKGRKSAKKHLKGIAKKMERDVASLSSSGGFVISDENIIGYKLITKKGDTIFDVSRQVLPILERAFRRYDLTFHFQTREMSAWIKSAHTHEIWMRTETKSLEEFSRLHADKLDWNRGYRQISRSLSSPVTFVDISNDRFRGTVGKSLLEYFDVPPEVLAELEIPEIKNPSPSPEEVERKRERNRVRLIERAKAKSQSKARRAG